MTPSIFRPPKQLSSEQEGLGVLGIDGDTGLDSSKPEQQGIPGCSRIACLGSFPALVSFCHPQVPICHPIFVRIGSISSDIPLSRCSVLSDVCMYIQYIPYIGRCVPCTKHGVFFKTKAFAAVHGSRNTTATGAYTSPGAVETQNT